MLFVKHVYLLNLRLEFCFLNIQLISVAVIGGQDSLMTMQNILHLLVLQLHRLDVLHLLLEVVFRAILRFLDAAQLVHFAVQMHRIHGYQVSLRNQDTTIWDWSTWGGSCDFRLVGLHDFTITQVETMLILGRSVFAHVLLG